MKKEIFSGKTIEEAKEVALQELDLNETDVIIKELKETKTLFNKKCEVEVITKKEIINCTKNFITKIIELIGLSVSIEYKIRDGVIYFNIITDNAPLLIGKNGKNIESLQTIVNTYLSNELGFRYRLFIDVSDYKKQKEVRLVKLAKNLAKDVIRSNCEIKLDPMNSYERRIVHNALADSKKVRTESFGEEPNRYVVIKPKD